MNKIKIVHTIPSIKAEAKGPSYSVNRLNQVLNQNNTNSIICCSDGVEFDQPNSFIRSFDLGFGPKKLGSSPTMLKWLFQQAKNSQVDILHNHSLWMMSNVYPGWISKKYSIPLVVAPRGTLSSRAINSGSKIKKIFWPLFQFKVLKNCTCFHATSESEYIDIRRAGFKQPVAIIPNGIDIPNIFVPNNIKPEEPKTLLFLARIHPIKGLDILLPAWSLIEKKFPLWQLKIVGSDSDNYLKVVKKMAKDLKLKQIVFTGPVYGDAKWLEYALADIYVLPTYSENFGVSVAEAASCGVPVITTTGAPWKTLVEHNAGWWVEPSIEGLANVLISALSLPSEKLKMMGNNGKRLMQKDYSWDIISQQITQLYFWILNKNIIKPDFVRIN